MSPRTPKGHVSGCINDQITKRKQKRDRPKNTCNIAENGDHDIKKEKNSSLSNSSQPADGYLSFSSRQLYSFMPVLSCPFVRTHKWPDHVLSPLSKAPRTPSSKMITPSQKPLSCERDAHRINNSKCVWWWWKKGAFSKPSCQRASSCPFGRGTRWREQAWRARPPRRWPPRCLVGESAPPQCP